MKKIFFAAALAITAIAGLHAQSADIAALETKLAATKPNNYWELSKINIQIEAAKRGAPETFDGLQKLIELGAEKVTYINEEHKNNLVKNLTSVLARWWYKEAFIKDGYAYAKANTDINRWGVDYIVYYNPKLGIPDAERYQLTKQVLIGRKMRHNDAMKAVTQFMELAPFMDEAEVKADLKKLNRLYSPLLIEDKTAWEPVVAMIRTALETY